MLADVAGFAFVTRAKEYGVLDHPQVQARLHLPPDQLQQRPESQTVRSLYDCPEVLVGPEGVHCRVVVVTHPEGSKKSPVGITRAGIHYFREADGSLRVVYGASIRLGDRGRDGRVEELADILY